MPLRQCFLVATALFTSLPLSACGGQTTPVAGAATTSNADAAAPVPRFFTSLQVQAICLPQALPTDPQTGLTSCLIFEGISGPTSRPSASGAESTCNSPSNGLSVPDAATLAALRAYVGSSDPNLPLCQLTQLPAGCSGSTVPGWCYASGATAENNCPQSFAFSQGVVLDAATQLWLGCP